MKFRKKPVEIDAFQMTKARRVDNSEWPEWLHKAWNMGRAEIGSLHPISHGRSAAKLGMLAIATAPGEQIVDWDDWIIRDPQGGLDSSTPETFARLYKAVVEPAPVHTSCRGCAYRMVGIRDEPCRTCLTFSEKGRRPCYEAAVEPAGHTSCEGCVYEEISKRGEPYKTGDQVTINAGVRCAIVSAAPFTTHAGGTGFADGTPWQVRGKWMGSLILSRDLYISPVLVYFDDVTRYEPSRRR